SRRSANPTESTRSQNITLSCRCSARLDGDGGCPIAVGGAGTSRVKEAPQSEQKFELASLKRPQVPHTRDKSAPHLAQNLPPPGRSALQTGHSMTRSRAGRSMCEASEPYYDESMLCATVEGSLRAPDTLLSHSFAEPGAQRLRTAGRPRFGYGREHRDRFPYMRKVAERIVSSTRAVHTSFQRGTRNLDAGSLTVSPWGLGAIAWVHPPWTRMKAFRSSM